MWLINVHTYELKAFNDNAVPKYAILSHTWGSEEILFRDMQAPTEAVRLKAGYNKILGACATARGHKLDWIWIDTCCIDKSSSAELSEAINSMYRYYKQAYLCYVYLEDVECRSEAFFHQCSHSRWWSRGWTLQELIAPNRVNFYNRAWMWFGTRNHSAVFISLRTGVPVEVLEGESPMRYSVAQRISWASKRQTTREEDQAYCLLGLLEINMPMLYGEGSKAFIRLQEEVIKTSADLSVLAWTLPTNPADPLSYFTGVLAESPAWFKDCSDKPTYYPNNQSYAMMNQGLTITTILYYGPQDERPRFAYLPLGSGGRGMYLVLTHLYATQYARVHTGMPLCIEGSEKSPRSINVIQANISMDLMNPAMAAGVLFRIGSCESWTPSLIHVFSEDVDQHDDATARMQEDIQHEAAFSTSTLALAPFPRARDGRIRRWVALGINEGNLLHQSDDLRHFVFEFGVSSPTFNYDHGVTTGHLQFRWKLRGAAEIRGLHGFAQQRDTWPLPLQNLLFEEGPVPSLPLEGSSVSEGQWKLLPLNSTWEPLDYGSPTSYDPLCIRARLELLNHRLYIVTDIRFVEPRTHNMVGPDWRGGLKNGPNGRGWGRTINTSRHFNDNQTM